jgi:hypothetical protein
VGTENAWCDTITLVKKSVALDRLVWPAGVAVAIIAAFLAVNPFLEMAINDDWTYSRMSQLLLGTGRLHFDGWTDAMVGLHAVWGALFIKAFGFSFTILRFSTLVTAVGCALVCHVICRRLGLSSAMSAFTAMSLMLSPLAITMTSTFMTDITGLFLSLVALYCVLRCTQASANRAFAGWLFATAGAGLLACTVRQMLFLPPVSMIVSVVLMRWRSRAALTAGVCALLVLDVSAAALLSWHDAQPGSTHQVFSSVAPSLALIGWGARMAAFSALTVVALATPILASALTIPAAWKSGGFAVLLIAGLVFAAGAQEAVVLLPPWLGNVVTEYGGLPPNQTVLGDKPVVLPPGARMLFAAVMYLAAALVAGVGLRALYDRFQTWDWRKPSLRDRQGLTLAVIVLPATGVYCAALVSHCMTPSLPPSVVFDRYLLPVMGMILPALAFLYHSLISPRVTPSGWAVLALLAGLGIAMTHDQIAVSRAILAATDRLAGAGVSRTSISAGYEYNGWTQLLAGENIAPAALTPLDFGHPRFWFDVGTPVVQGCYYVVLSPQLGLIPGEFEPIRYHTWFSPRQREVFIERDPVHGNQCTYAGS